MMALLSPRLWLALALAAALALSHGMAYRSGRAAVRASWDADIAQRTAQALQAEQAARAKEQVLIEKTRKVSDALHAEKTKRAADAVVAADRLRDYEAALDRATGADTSATARADDPAIAIARQCARSLVLLDGYASGLASQVRGLQDYTSAVRVTP